MDSLILKGPNSFQNYNSRKVTPSFAHRRLIYKLQQGILKFNDICMSWSSLKLTLRQILLNPENRSFENVSIVTFN